MLKSMRKSKNRYFYHIFVSPGDAPVAITLNVVWMETEFDAYKLSRSMYPSIFNIFPMYLSIFNSFRVIRRLNQCVSPKIAIFTTFLFYPGDAPIRCLQIVPLYVFIYLLPFLRYSEIFVKKSSFYHTPCIRRPC